MKKSYLSRKDSIILTAIEIIDDLGIQELSTRELADRQGVSEAALYRHFKSKQGIILAVLDYYTMFDEMIAGTIEKEQFEAKEGIRFFVRTYIENLQNDPPLTAVLISCGVLAYNPVFAQRIREIVDSRFETLRRLIMKGQQDGEITAAIQPDVLAHLILGLNHFLVSQWRLSGYAFPLKEKVMTALESLLLIC